VLVVLGVGFLLLGGQFTALTYLTPYLTEVSGISAGLVSGFLLVFGLATAVGAFLGGRAADRSATTTLMVGNALLILTFGGLYLVGSRPLLVALALAGWGLVGFGLVPSLQLRVISLAGPGADLAATLPASALNAGIAAGALIGGWAIASQGIAAAVLVAAVICAFALPATWATRFLAAPAAANADKAEAAIVPEAAPAHSAEAVKEAC
jgi:DHA1 family inner membrane transport protein